MGVTAGTEHDGLVLVVSAIAKTPGCEVFPPTGEKFQTTGEEVEPADLIQLRRSSGGLLLHDGSGYPWTVLSSPVLASPLLLGPVADQVRADSPDDLTN